MNIEKDHNCRNDEQTKSDIEKYGFTVIIIEGTDYFPAFVYSIGLVTFILLWVSVGRKRFSSFQSLSVLYLTFLETDQNVWSTELTCLITNKYVRSFPQKRNVFHTHN